MDVYETPKARPARPTVARHVFVLPPIRLEVGLVSCSRCLRVQRGPSWVDAEDVIRDLRSFELAEAVKLLPGLCDRCSARIDSARRQRIDDRLAA